MKIGYASLLFAIFIMAVQAAPVLGSNPGDAIETTQSGLINWTAGEVLATGTGAPPTRAVNAAQARAMAERAAFVVALRNLLETVKGVRVDSETRVENFMVTSDVIRTRVDGIVKGARIVKTQYMSDGSVEVQVSMPLRGPLMDAILPLSFGSTIVGPPSVPPSGPQKTVGPSKPLQQPQKLAEPLRPASPAPGVPEMKPEPLKPQRPVDTPQEKKAVPPVLPPPSSSPRDEPTVAFKGGVATGLVIDGRGLGLRPALLPKIVDTQGQEIYVGKIASRTNSVEQGVAGYAKDVNAATNNFRVTDNPAVIRGLRASGSARTDVVIGPADARMLGQLGTRGDFLQYCRVIIVY